MASLETYRLLTTTRAIFDIHRIHSIPPLTPAELGKFLPMLTVGRTSKDSFSCSPTVA